VCVATLLAGTALQAHHSYGAYDREHPVRLLGTVRAFAFKNPHPLITLDTTDGHRYEIEWSSGYRLSCEGIDGTVLLANERIEVIGYVMRDPAQRRMSLVRMVRRVRDGWQWGEPPEGVS
jgi:hypothetical protein